MAKIDLSIKKSRRTNAVNRARERNIVIPTIEQQIHPETIPAGIKEELKSIGLWDIHPRNLFGSTGKMNRKPKAARLAASTSLNCRPASQAWMRASSYLWGNGFQPAPIKSARHIHASFRRWSPVNLIRLLKKQSGPPPGTIAAAAHSSLHCWPANQSQSYRKA